MRFLLAAVVAVLLVSVLPISAPTARAQSDRPTTTVEVTKVTPSIVGPDAPAEMTITGRLTNTSDQVIEDVEARVQRGNPATSESAVQEALGDNISTVTEPSFSPVTDSLAPGQQTQFELRIPITGGKDSLQISEPGAHPILINVNGAPQNGSRARIGEAQFLLPVTAPPGAPPAAPPKPTPTTMLVPIVDYPRLQQQASPGQPAVLIDDQLAESIAPGGRLYELVQAVDDTAGPGSAMGSALCFAIDPDLIATVETMRQGYQVRGSNGSTYPGSGSGAAELWLSKLKSATSGRCVIALPFADVDVTALGRADLPDLIKGALDGARIIEDVLGVEPRRDVLWPIGGAIDEPAASQLTAPELGPQRIHTLLMQPSAIDMPQGSLEQVRIDSGSDPVAQPIDPLLTQALNPQHGTPDTRPAPRTNGTLSAQDALGALTFRATGGATPGTSLLAPPRRWNIGGEGMRALLGGMQELIDAGYLQPSGLPRSEDSWATHASAHQELPEHGLSYPATATASEIRQPLLGELARENFKVGDLYRSSKEDPAASTDPGRLTTPLRDGLLRGASSAWRGNPAASRYWVHKAADTIDGVLSNVQLAGFPAPIKLAASNAYIPVTVTNNLPVTVSARLRVPRTAGIEPKNLGELQFPARGRRTIWLETEVHRAGQFTVDLSLSTENGTQFGDPKRLQVQSNAYGQLTIVLTAIAGVLLVVLSARRIFRRMRARSGRGGNEGPGGGGAPPPGPSDEPTPPDGAAAPATEPDSTAQEATNARGQEQS